MLKKDVALLEIHWLNEDDPVGNRIFDTMWEVEEWVDSLYPDFGGGCRANVGYWTTDEKVFLRLSEELPRWAEYTQADILIHKDTEIVDRSPLYKIWITERE